MRILGMLLAALKNALVGLIDFGWWLITWPVRAMTPQGRSAVDRPGLKADDVRQAIAAAAAKPAPDMAMAMPSRDQIAARVLRWAVATVQSRQGSAEQIAMGLPPSVRTWLQNLTTADAEKLVRARVSGVSAHLDGTDEIEDMPPLKRKTAPPPKRRPSAESSSVLPTAMPRSPLELRSLLPAFH
jgi:hypothetical protein